ncbi:MAG: hypothetical protein WCR49_10605, partial [Opitutae bacterium]
MITEPQEELAALYAFGLLEGGEKASFESALAENAELRTLVAQLAQRTPALAFSAPQIQPPSGLKARILENCAAQRPTDNAPGLARVAQDVNHPWLPASSFLYGTSALKIPGRSTPARPGDVAASISRSRLPQPHAGRLNWSDLPGAGSAFGSVQPCCRYHGA